MKLTRDDKINIVSESLRGKSLVAIRLQYQVNRTTIQEIMRLYHKHGITIFKDKNKNKSYSAEFKLSIINRVLAGESKNSIATELAVNVGMISSWCMKFKESGYNGLTIKQGRPRKMKPNKNTAKSNKDTMLTKDEKIKELEQQNKQLEMEIDLLKKLNALVQQRTQQQEKKK